jgi:hypothetical protein
VFFIHPIAKLLRRGRAGVWLLRQEAQAVARQALGKQSFMVRIYVMGLT